jgi:hypothetical protein
LGPTRGIRAAMRRRRLAILFNLGRHRRIVQATRTEYGDDSSTWKALRSGSLRMVGRLDEAADVASVALERARLEGHPQRASNAAFQLALTHMWQGDIPGARTTLNADLRPLAKMAGNRWMAWADFLEGALAVHERDVLGANLALSTGQIRFKVERLGDGLISVMMARLTLARLENRHEEFLDVWSEIHTVMNSSTATNYPRGQPLRQQALAVELGEFIRCGGAHDEDPKQLFAFAAESEYPYQSACGLLGLAAWHIENGPAEAAIVHLERAAATARTIGARGLLSRASALSHWRQGRSGERPPQWFSPP